MTPDEQTISEILSLVDDKAKIAMIQLYAKQKCIAFSKWLECNAYYDGDGWYKDDMLTTIENLYTLFLNHQ